MTTGGRVALITGGSRGIGLGIARRLAEQGYSLTITARNPETLDDAAAQLRDAGAPQVATIAADLGVDGAAEAIVTAHTSAFETLDVLVLNAGVGTAGEIAEFPMRRFAKTLDVNVRAPFEILQHAIPLLRDSAMRNPDRGAKIVALSSITGVYAEAGLAVYGAAKAAMLSLVETLNAEENHRGIAATAIAPGYVETDMSAWTTDTIPAATMIGVDDVVELVDGVLRLSARAVVSRIVVTRSGSPFKA